MATKQRRTTTKARTACQLPAFKLTPAIRALHAELSRLYRAAYRCESPPENASRRQWTAWRQRQAEAREAFEDFAAKALAKHWRLVSPEQLVELAVLGAYQTAADRTLGAMIRRAAGLRL